MRYLSAALPLLAVLAVAPTSAAEEAVTPATEGEEKPQTTCPVMKGNKIDENLYVDHEGERIYVCCRGCIGPVKKDFGKYAKQLEKQNVTLERVEENADADNDGADAE